MILETFPEIQALSRAQKLLLLDELDADVNADAYGKEQSAAIKAFLERRYAEFLANPGAFVTMEDHLAKLDEAKRARAKARIPSA